MITTALVAIVSAILGALLGAIVMAALAAAADADDTSELVQEAATLRQQLDACQQIGAANKERADYYYDLFCSASTAQLRHNGGNHAA